MLIGFKCFVYIYHYQVICHIMIQCDLSKFSALELSRYTFILDKLVFFEQHHSRANNISTFLYKYRLFLIIDTDTIQFQILIYLPIHQNLLRKPKKRLTNMYSPTAVLSHCYQRTLIVLSDHPRWMFKKNSIEFPIVFCLCHMMENTHLII